MVSDSDAQSLPDKFEPGCCDMEAGIRIADSVYDTYNRTSLHSPLSLDLWRRYEIIDGAVAEMDDGDGLFPWWEKFPQPLKTINHTVLLRPGLNYTDQISQKLRQDRRAVRDS